MLVKKYILFILLIIVIVQAFVLSITYSFSTPKNGRGRSRLVGFATAAAAVVHVRGAPAKLRRVPRGRVSFVCVRLFRVCVKLTLASARVTQA